VLLGLWNAKYVNEYLHPLAQYMTVHNIQVRIDVGKSEKPGEDAIPGNAETNCVFVQRYGVPVSADPEGVP
jgi:hypothetical protein